MIRRLPVAFLIAAYLLTTVLGNLPFATPVGAWALATLNYPTESLSYPETFTPGFWLLLALPLFVTPRIAWLTVKAAQRLQIDNLPRLEIGRIEFATASAALMTYLLAAFWQSGAFSMATSSGGFAPSVETRFAIRDALGHPPLVALQSLLWFAALYAVIRSIRERKMFWIASAIITVLTMIAGLVLL